MYCPNCGKNNSDEQKYCRTCGFELEGVNKIVEKIRVAQEDDTFFSARLFDKLGRFFMYAFFAVAFAYVFYLSVYYKFEIFGIETMFMFAVFGFFLLGFLSLLFFGFKHFKLKSGSTNRDSGTKTQELNAPEGALVESTFEPIGSVTENSTELLYTKNRTTEL